MKKNPHVRFTDPHPTKKGKPRPQFLKKEQQNKPKKLFKG